MMNASGGVLHIERRIDAPVEDAFDAFINPTLLREWAAPSGHYNEHVEVDVRQGGQYRREMRFPDGSLHTLMCVYEEIDPPFRLVYTFGFETIPDVPATRVSVDLRGDGGGTHVLVSHGPFSSAEHQAPFEDGWNDCMDKLARLFVRSVGIAQA
jgi:uncharacterized protein YndB with AHSA1/START domain